MHDILLRFRTKIMVYSARSCPMSKPIPRDRLQKLCGLFGSQHDGERAAAAALEHFWADWKRMRWVRDGSGPE